MRKIALAAAMVLALASHTSNTVNAAIILNFNNLSSNTVAAGGTGTFDIQATNDTTFTSGGYSIGVTTTNPDLTFTLATVSGVNYIHTDNTGFDNSSISLGAFSDTLAASESVANGSYTLATVTFAISPSAASGTAVLDFDLLVSLFDDGSLNVISPTSAGSITINIIGAVGAPEPAMVSLGIVANLSLLGLVWFRRRRVA